MKKNKGLFFKILLNRGELSPQFLQPLPKEESAAILAYPTEASDLTPLMHQKSRGLAKWHYSWIIDLIKPLNPLKKQALISLLNENQKEGVLKTLKIAPQHDIPPPLIFEFYQFHLYPLLQWDSVLPIEYLPKSPFNALLDLQKSDLVKLMDLLGLYDLAHEVKHIVAKKTLKDIYACLNPNQLMFLRQCLHTKDNVMAPNLHLENWNGGKKELMQILHRRGISRIALALSGQHPDLIWHLAHILDTGRGQLLQKCTQKEKIPSLSDAVGLQVENAMNTLLKRITP